MLNVSKRVNAMNDEDDKEAYAPGTYGCHEALHMASFLCDAVDVELCEHGAIKLNPEWARLAEGARAKLQELYNLIAEAHHAGDEDGGSA